MTRPNAPTVLGTHGGVVERHYSTLTQLVDDIRDLGGKGGSSDTDWAGGTMKQAISLATNGWPEGVRQAKDLAFRLVDRIAQASYMADIQGLGFDVTGACLDVGAHLSGTPECFLVPTLESVKRGVRFVANVCVSSGVPEDTIRTRGIAMAALVMAMQSAGYPVTVDIMAGMETSGQGHRLTTVRVADADSGSPLDIDRMVYAMAHPTILRQLLFAAQRDGGRAGGIGWAERKEKGGKRTRGENMEPIEGGPIDLYVGGAHMEQAKRWEDGGEAWVISEYERLTRAG